MSQRESIGDVSLQQWRGVNQRLQPTLVPDGFFSDVRGVMFGYGENAERLPGKVASGFLGTPILGIFAFGQIAILQTIDSVITIPLSEIFGGEILPLPTIDDNNDLPILDSNNEIILANS